jgi:protein SCO1/2
MTSCAKHYSVDGMVLALHHDSMTVSHRDIPHYMPAMIMPFEAAHPNELKALHPGSLVAFELAVSKHHTRAMNIRSRGDKPEFVPTASPVALHGHVPNFTLTTESNEALSLADLKGKVIVLDFLYTRCPLPTVCPRLAANFARLQRRFQPQLGKQLVLLSITLDPQYDTPAVLAGYSKLWHAQAPGWRFLTGNMGKIRQIAQNFGVLYWPEDGTLAHSTLTAIIDAQGRLTALVDGPNYAVSQLGDLINTALKETPQ